MLVLTRKSRDTIRIGNSVTVTILRVKGNTVRVGIEAPRSVRVLRGELPDDFKNGDSKEDEFKEGGATEQGEGLPSQRPLSGWRNQARMESRQERPTVESVLTPEMMAQYCA